jgi:hypothetical protein
MKLRAKLAVGALLIGVSMLAFYSGRHSLNGHVFQDLAVTTTERLSSVESVLHRAATDLTT